MSGEVFDGFKPRMNRDGYAIGARGWYYLDFFKDLLWNKEAYENDWTYASTVFYILLIYIYICMHLIFTVIFLFLFLYTHYEVRLTSKTAPSQKYMAQFLCVYSGHYIRTLCPKNFPKRCVGVDARVNLQNQPTIWVFPKIMVSPNHPF